MVCADRAYPQKLRIAAMYKIGFRGRIVVCLDKKPRIAALDLTTKWPNDNCFFIASVFVCLNPQIWGKFPKKKTSVAVNNYGSLLMRIFRNSMSCSGQRLHHFHFAPKASKLGRCLWWYMSSTTPSFQTTTPGLARMMVLSNLSSAR